MKIRNLLILLIVAFLAVYCSSSKNATGIDSDAWYNQPVTNHDGYIYVIGESLSARQSLARKKARQDGRAQLAKKVQSEILAVTESGQKELMADSSSNITSLYKNFTRTMAKQSLQGIETRRTHIGKQDNGLYIVRLLMRMPIVQAGKSLEKSYDRSLATEDKMRARFDLKKFDDSMRKAIATMKKGQLPSKQ